MTPQLGSYGVVRKARETDAALAAEVERLGYTTLWLSGSPEAGLAVVDEVLGATRSLAVGTAIVNVWKAPADTVAASFARIESRWPGRFLLGTAPGTVSRAPATAAPTPRSSPTSTA